MSSAASPQRARTRLVVLGGFLGAGKTTAIAEFAKYVKARQSTVSVLTNDHGSELVDSALLQAQGIQVRAVEGGDLCTQSLRAADRLRQEQRSQIIVAEPAGTCADLRSTLLGPARAQQFVVAPLSVLVDPVRAARVFGLEAGAELTRKIDHLYRRQVAEAEIIVVNKSDLVSADNMAALRDAISQTNPGARIFTVSAKGGIDLDEWFDCLMSKETSGDQKIGFTDVALSAHPDSADQLLAWLNCTVGVSSVKYFEAGKVLLGLAASVQSLLQQEGGQIAHLKMALIPGQDATGIAAVSLDRYDASPNLLFDVSEPIQRGELILNARAHADPEILHSVVNRALLALMERSPDLFARMRHCEHFKAGLCVKAQLSPAAD